MNRTWTLIMFLAVLLVAVPAAAQKSGDPFHPHSQECISAPWVVAANGYREADVAVAGTLIARADGLADMIYVNEEHVPSSTKDYLRREYAKGGSALYVVGGEEAVHEKVISKLIELGNFHAVRRINGATRSETAAIANYISGNCK